MRFCFQLIEKGSVPPEIKEQAPYWYLRSLLNAGQYSAAEAYARSQVERMQPPASQGQVSFCAALVREGFTECGGERPTRHDKHSDHSGSAAWLDSTSWRPSPR